jgi:HEPN domain-containing protein
MKNKSAVEWLEKELKKIPFANPKEVFEQAKEMEKQQIIDAWENGYEHGACVNEDEAKYHGIQYYNETFKNKNNEDSSKLGSSGI